MSDNRRLVGDVRRETLGPAQDKIGALEVLNGDIVWGCWELKRKFRIPEASSVKPASSFEAQTYHKVDLRLLPFLFLCYILAYLDRVNVGFAKLQMLKDLSLSDAAFATGAGIFFIGYFFFEVPSNILLKKFGHACGLRGS